MSTIWEYLEKHDLTDTVCEGLDRLDLGDGRSDDVLTALAQGSLVINYRAKSRFGLFSPSKQIIELTSEYFNNDWDSVKEDHHNTLLHEVAHLVVHYAWELPLRRNGGLHRRNVQSHGREWKAVMRAFGLKPERCGKSNILNDVRKTRTHKHLYTCVKCGYEHATQRELKNMDRRYHAKCGGRFSHQRAA